MAKPFDNTQQQEAWAQHGHCQGPDTQVLSLDWDLTGGLRAPWNGLLTALEYSLCRILQATVTCKQLRPLCIDLTWVGEDVSARGEAVFCFCFGRDIKFNTGLDHSHVAWMRAAH